MRALIWVIAALAALVVAPAASADYGLVRQFGSAGAAPGQFNTPIGVGVGPDGHVFVTDGLNDRVQELLPDGTVVRTYGQTGTQRGDLRLPEDALSDGQSLYVSDCYNARITEYSVQTGRFVQAWGQDQHAADPSFNCPENLALSPSGRLYVADTFNNRVVSFDPHATSPSFASFGSTGGGPGQFTQVHGLQFTQDGSLLVGDDDPHSCALARIQRFTATGSYLGPFGTFSAGTGPGQLFCIWDIDQDAAGNVFVSDAAARIYALTADGALVRQVNAPGQLGFGIGLDSNASCELYAVDRNNARVAVFGWAEDPRCRAITPVPPPATTLPADTTAPTLIATTSVRTTFGSPLRASVACPFENCSVTLAATARLKRSRAVTRLASSTATLSAGRRITLTARLSRSSAAVVRAYLRTHRALTVTLRLAATDPAGNRTSKVLHTSLRRRGA